jgi:hypothetical protein
MIRSQIQLPEEDLRRLKAYARARDISVAEAVRRAVSVLLEREPGQPARAERVRRFLAVAGRHHDRSGRRDVALHHDRYLDEAYAARRPSP